MGRYAISIRPEEYPNYPNPYSHSPTNAIKSYEDTMKEIDKKLE